MITLRLLRVKGVLLPESVTAATSDSVPSWTVELRHGSEKHRSQFSALASSNPAAPLQHEPRRVDLRTASGSPWERDIEFEDMGGEERVDVTLLFDPSPKYASALRKPQMLRHSKASIDVQAFRSQPEERVEVWLPLQPANPRQGDSHDFGTMQVSCVYTDDYVAQGYMFGLLCGLSPLWQHKWNRRLPCSL
eukprot:g5456.t1